ncbi:hypothetical protein BS47DRAFT_1453701 [Hydnum rufescens UP504]|uniref:Xylanolytic transcriptional activator regulatory domain-containing protein n=1 Tax=Hydnum rufescens UP504 TaxID=1448309 RepID=A0A9P6AYE9_9AGAM|nr:hypothetical protein BS47DRAFT_1453701 [Hydnum rufescens UP504]
MHLFIDPLYPDEGPCVTFKLIHQLPTQSVRDVLLRHLEMTMLMHPSFNFPTFKRRVEALFDPILFSPGSPPTESEKPHVGGAAALAKRPSLAFFAATVGGLALGARVASSSISHSSPTPQSERGETSPPGEASALPYSADALFLLSTQALAVAEFNQNYDLDHISAVLLNGLFLLHDGKQRVAHTIYPTIGKLVNIAKMMGLHIDPDEFPGKYTLYDAECRRRSWWDVYYYDLFMSDCMGQEPLIDDNTCTTRLPADVDEDAFHPGSETLPPPRQESNFAYFRQKCRCAMTLAQYFGVSPTLMLSYLAWHS